MHVCGVHDSYFLFYAVFFCHLKKICHNFCKNNNKTDCHQLTGILFVEYFSKKRRNIMAFIDYYKIMGIPKDTPQKDIKSAYRNAFAA